MRRETGGTGEWREAVIRYTILPSSEASAHEAEKRLGCVESERARRRGAFRPGNQLRRAGRIYRCEKWGCITCMQRFVRNYYNRVSRERKAE